MAVWLLVGFWVLAGLAVFALAMRGSARRQRPGEATTRVRGLVVLVGLAALACVAVIPALALVEGGSEQARAGQGGVDLTADQAEGRQLFARNCANCHQLDGASAVGRSGPSLDQRRPNKQLVLDAIEKGRAQGNGNMPAELLTGEDARHVADFVAAVAGR